MARVKQISSHQASTFFTENFEEMEDKQETLKSKQHAFSYLVHFLFHVHPPKWAIEY